MEIVSYAAIAGCYLAIIALYVWVFKVINEVKDQMNHHHQDGAIHADSGNFQRRDVCQQTVLRIEQSMRTLGGEMKEVKSQMSEGFKNVVDLLKKGG